MEDNNLVHNTDTEVKNDYLDNNEEKIENFDSIEKKKMNYKTKKWLIVGGIIIGIVIVAVSIVLGALVINGVLDEDDSHDHPRGCFRQKTSQGNTYFLCVD